MSTSLLAVEGVSAYYGNALAIDQIDLAVDARQIVALIGANGAGKSTVLKTISRLLDCARGRIVVDGVDLTALPPHAVISHGVAQVPEGRRLFPQLTARENLLMGAYPKTNWKDRKALIDEACQYFPRLGERLDQLAGTMSGGEQQMLAIGRALMARPRLLMLDEPSLGLAPKIVEDIFRILLKINQDGVAILLVEQNVQLALKAASKVYLLENGTIAAAGDPQRMLGDESIRRAYLGV